MPYVCGVAVLLLLPPVFSGSSYREMKVLSIFPCCRASSFLPPFIIFFMTLYVHKLESAQFTVVGPGHPVTAMVGEDTVLPCHVSPRMSAENMEVRWFRSEFTSFVHLYQHGKDEYGQQMPEYYGRTELSKAGIMDGNVALRIGNVRLSDEGQYHCFVQDGVFYEEAVLEVVIEASGSAPQISVEGYQDGGIRMVCQLAGWYPEPKVQWRDLRGQRLSSPSETKSRDERGLFEIKSSIIVMEQSNQNLSCSISSTRFNVEKEPSIFYISDFFFPRTSPWLVVWSVTVVISLVFISLTLYLFKLRGEHLNTISKLRTQLDLRRSLSDAANVTLDPATARPGLVLSEDRKSVRRAETQQDLLNAPERFDSDHSVQGCEEFTSGRHRWEVEVGDGGGWVVGVATESLRRKGLISPEGGIWAVGQNGGQFQALTDPVTTLTLSQAPSRIRVCLDCDQRQVTFIDAGAEATIFTFPSDSLSGKRIRPWLWVGQGTQLRLCP
ncbi:butyrophilin subfamily 1 member A1-like [Carettochelys insculpta]|uniref:butyrophilin subfamily 1 member A1-like n=1 Tax=Carettochelys insculpta TaxID=44489 RepID=UPI003EB72296